MTHYDEGAYLISESGNTFDPISIRAGKLQRFVEEYVIDGNGARAAIAAGYKRAGARVRASELLQRSDVQRMINKEQQALSDRTHITQDAVLRRLWDIATADPRELIEVRRCCCRYCYGEGHRYQRTPRELEEFRKQWEASASRKRGVRRRSSMKPLEVFDAQGGVGYDASKDPTGSCPECFGEGVVRVFAHDTRSLSPTAQVLYASARPTKSGIDIRMHDRLQALVHVARAIGMFADKPQTSPSAQSEHDAFLESVLGSISEPIVGLAISRRKDQPSAAAPKQSPSPTSQLAISGSRTWQTNRG